MYSILRFLARRKRKSVRVYVRGVCVHIGHWMGVWWVDGTLTAHRAEYSFNSKQLSITRKTTQDHIYIYKQKPVPYKESINSLTYKHRMWLQGILHILTDTLSWNGLSDGVCWTLIWAKVPLTRPCANRPGLMHTQPSTSFLNVSKSNNKHVHEVVGNLYKKLQVRPYNHNVWGYVRKLKCTKVSVINVYAGFHRE